MNVNSFQVSSGASVQKYPMTIECNNFYLSRTFSNFAPSLLSLNHDAIVIPTMMILMTMMTTIAMMVMMMMILMILMMMSQVKTIVLIELRLQLDPRRAFELIILEQCLVLSCIVNFIPTGQ